jgi:hypothetical protein
MSGEAASNGTTPGKLRAIDPVGTWWEVDPSTGTPTYKRQSLLGALSLIDAKATSFPGHSGGIGGTGYLELHRGIVSLTLSMTNVVVYL